MEIRELQTQVGDVLAFSWIICSNKSQMFMHVLYFFLEYFSPQSYENIIH